MTTEKKIVDSRKHICLFMLAPVFLSLFFTATFGQKIFEPELLFVPSEQFDTTSLIYNFGNVKEGKPVSFKIELQNNGSVPLVITNVKSSCGCLTVSWIKEPIAPGATSYFTGRLITRARVGPCVKTITVISNARNSPHIVRIKGYIEPSSPD